MKWKKLSAGALFTALTVLFSMGVSAQDTNVPYEEVEPQTTAGGEYSFVYAGENNQSAVGVFDWEIDLTTGVLNLDVKGYVPAEFDYFERDLPWKDYEDETKKVILGEGFTAVGFKMFEEYDKLEEVVLPKTITEFYNYGFAECSSLKRINIPESVKRIGTSSFRGCSALESVALPKGLEKIGKRVFGRCASLKEIVIPDGITIIDANTFSSCTSLEKVTIPDSVRKIQMEAFAACTSLKEIHIPNGVTTIGQSVFQSCTSLESIKLPTALKSLGRNAFYRCKKLTEIVIPNKVTEIKAQAFSGCTALQRVRLPKNLKKIGNSAFYNTALQTIEIPEQVTEIGAWAFEHCKVLTEVKLPDGLTALGNGAFYGCKMLTSVSLPSGLTSLDNNVFGSCVSLTEVKLPEGITYIGGGAFSECKKLTEIILPESLIEIDYWAFENCKSLTTIHIPKNVEKISNPFWGCKKLESITADVENVHYTSIDGVLLNKDATKILFYPDGKKSMSYVVPSTVKTLDFDQLQDDTDSYLKAIVVPTSVTTLQGYPASNQVIITTKNSRAWLYAKEYGHAKSQMNPLTPYAVWNLRSEEYYSHYKLKWEGSSATAAYQIYRYDSAKGKYVKKAVTTAKSYKVDLNEKGAKYAVRSFTVGADGTIRYGAWRYVTVK